MDFKLELVVLPVSDVDRAKAFYADKVGFNVDVDHRAGDFRVVQLTPPGSACSVTIGQGVTEATPGSVHGLHLVVSDIEAAVPSWSDGGSTSARSSTSRATNGCPDPAMTFGWRPNLAHRD
jgi:catechol 2,3-dioxygenase-like lactoylglutathione lyase family enzyme